MLCCRDLNASRDFYMRLFELNVVFECGWYAALAEPKDQSFQLGLVLPDHRSVPAGFGLGAAGVLVTVEVDGVEATHERAVAMGCAIVVPVRDEEFGQRHFMTVDPAGVLVDVVTQIPPTTGFLREVALWRRENR